MQPAVAHFDFLQLRFMFLVPAGQLITLLVFHGCLYKVSSSGPTNAEWHHSPSSVWHKFVMKVGNCLNWMEAKECAQMQIIRESRTGECKQQMMHLKMACETCVLPLSQSHITPSLDENESACFALQKSLGSRSAMQAFLRLISALSQD